MPNGDLQSAGALLLAAREEQGLSVEEVAAQTRIRAKFIQALETGDYASLPSTTHARGFLRSYAQFLRVDVNTVLERFAEETGAAPRSVTQLTAEPLGYDPIAAATAAAAVPGAEPPLEDDEDIPPMPDDLEADIPPMPDEAAESPDEDDADEIEDVVAAEPDEGDDDAPLTADIIPPPPRSTYVPPTQRTGPGRPLTLTQAEIAAAAPPKPAKERRAPESRGARAVLRSNLFVAAVLGLGLVAIIWWVTTQLSQISGEELAGATSDATTPDSLDSGDLLPSPTFRLTSTPEPVSGPQILDRVVLSLTVVQRTWSVIEVDGEVAFEGASDPGEVLRFEGQEEIFVRTGNGAALDVNYNGQDLGPLGERGEVVERFFTLAGEATPTPTLTVTPTNTGVPTATPRITATPEPTTAGVARTAAPAITPTP